MIELVVGVVITITFFVVLIVESDNVEQHLRMLLLFLFCDTVGLQRLLPFFRQTLHLVSFAMQCFLEIRTVNCPVLESYPTCVTCTGFSGADMAGRFGAPTNEFIKLEKPLFFLVLPADSLASSLYLCVGLLKPPDEVSDGCLGVISSILRPDSARLLPSSM